MSTTSAFPEFNTTNTENVDTLDSRPEENSYHCSICHNVLYRPVTLICQHSYCYPCLETYYNGNDSIPDAHYTDVFYRSAKKDKCPLCNIPYTLPPIENTLFAELIEAKYPEQYNTQKTYYETKKNIEISKKLAENTIRKEIWNIISTDFSTTIPPSNVTLDGTQPQDIVTYNRNYHVSLDYAYRNRSWDMFKESMIKYSPIYIMTFGVLAGYELVRRSLRN